MAYRGTRRATSTKAVEKDKHDHLPQSPTDFIAILRPRAKSAEQQASDPHPQMAAATHLPTTPVGQQQRGREHHPHEAGESTAGDADELTRRVIALNINDTSRSAAAGGREKKIQTIPELKRELEGMCRTVFTTLGRQQQEFAYQLALQIELELRGIVVEASVRVFCGIR